MFLACCCPGYKKRKKGSSSSSSPAPPSQVLQPSPAARHHRVLSFQPHSPIFTVQRNSASHTSSPSEEDFFYYQDVYLHSKETLVPRSLCSTRSPLHTSASRISYIDTNSPLDNQTLPTSARTLPRPPPAGRPPARIFASPENFKLSVRSLSSWHSSRSAGSSGSPELLRNSFRLAAARYRPQTTSLSSTTSTDSDSYYHKPTEEENKLFAGGIKRSKPFHTAELLQQQLYVTEEEEPVETEEAEQSGSLGSEPSLLTEPSPPLSHATTASPASVKPLRKSTAFHDRALLEQQIADSERQQVEARRRLVEQYVQEVYTLKLEHQHQLQKVEDVYKIRIGELSLPGEAGRQLESAPPAQCEGGRNGSAGGGESLAARLAALQLRLGERREERARLVQQLSTVEGELSRAEAEEETLRRILDENCSAE